MAGTRSATPRRSVKRATLQLIARVPPPISLRLGRDGTRALEELARRRGISKAEAARQAIEETAAREKRRQGLAAEVRRLMEDPGYVGEAREVAALMEELRGPG
jgi:predicted transcriptional regulator